MVEHEIRKRKYVNSKIFYYKFVIDIVFLQFGIWEYKLEIYFLLRFACLQIQNYFLLNLLFFGEKHFVMF